MHKTVRSTGGKHKGELHKITIEKAGNGFSIKRHHKPPPASMGMMHEDEPAAVFTKHGPANAHVADAMREMHPQLPPAAGAAELPMEEE